MPDTTNTCPVADVAPAMAPRTDHPPEVRRANALKADPFFVTRHPVAAARRLAGRRVGLGAVPPGPRGLPGVGVWPEYARDPYWYLRRCADEYGDVFRLPLPVWDVLVFNHPDFVEEILCDRDGNFTFIGSLLGLMERWGASVTIMEGERFSQRRRSLAPMFSRRNLAQYADAIVDEMVTRVDAWDRWADSGETIDLQAAIAEVTLPAFLRSMYSTAIPDDELSQVDHDIKNMMSVVGSVTLGPLTPPPNMIPLPGVDSVPASYMRLRRMVSRLIDDRVANPIEQTDLLGLLLEVTEPDGSPVPRKDLIHELIILMGGGFDTVVAALSWTLGLLSLNPDPAQRLHAEVDALGGRPPRLDDLSSLTWAKACFDEAQRLQGGPLFTRFAARDTSVAGFPIRKGTLVGVGWHSMHLDPRWWPDPERYDPTRFTDRAVIDARPRYAFMPFGAGPHHCLGSGMGYMNGQFLLSIILQRYRITTPEGWRPSQDFKLATPLKGGLPVTLHRALATT